jgi:thiamine biosynthesis protein ThiS
MSATIDDIRVTLNGEPHCIPYGCTLAGLITAIDLDLRKIAVERNREIVPRSTYADVTLAPGDTLEIVHFIGGG